MVAKIPSDANRAAYDMQGLQDLRRQLRSDSKEGLKQAAQQFESMFLQMVMKSMRDTVPQDGLLDNDQSRMFVSLLDQQMAQNISGSGRGIGLAKLIEEQLGRNLPVQAPGQAMPAAEAAAILPPALPLTQRHEAHVAAPVTLPASSPAPVAAPTQGLPGVPATPQDFVRDMWPHAVEASRSTGIPPHFLIAHAALESGWGRSEPRLADGSRSFNLFGIKAGAAWQGGVAEAKTQEFIEGEMRPQVEKFRAYASYGEAFRDYAGLLRNNPRYTSLIGVRDGTEFAQRLQQAGYATDPAYADKLSRIINGPTLRQALIG
jgi:flagellar protein FlgJ